MKKIWTIAWKDTLVRFRDRNALLLMLAAPLLIAWIIGASFGGSLLGTGSGGAISDIPLLAINQDAGSEGAQLVAILTDGDALGDLLAVTETADLAQARQDVALGEARAALLIPADFSATVSGGDFGSDQRPSSTLQLYTDPAARITPTIIEAIVRQIANNYNTATIGAQLTVEQLLATAPQTLLAMGPVLEQEINAALEGAETAVRLNRIAIGEQEEPISPFAFFVPSMGVFFLVFAMMDGTRSILDEDNEGTLDRLLTTPTPHAAILLGKIGGVLLTGVLQFGVYVLASMLLFQIQWGNDPLALILLALAVVAAYTSIGTFLAAVARDATQAGIYGSIVALVAGALGGNFVPPQNFPDWLQQLSQLSPTRWGLDGFIDLMIFQLGLSAVLPEIAVLLGMSVLFFGLGLWQFRRRIAR